MEEALKIINKRLKAVRDFKRRRLVPSDFVWIIATAEISCLVSLRDELKEAMCLTKS